MRRTCSTHGRQNPPPPDRRFILSALRLMISAFMPATVLDATPGPRTPALAPVEIPCCGDLIDDRRIRGQAGAPDVAPGAREELEQTAGAAARVDGVGREPTLMVGDAHERLGLRARGAEGLKRCGDPERVGLRCWRSGRRRGRRLGDGWRGRRDWRHRGRGLLYVHRRILYVTHLMMDDVSWFGIASGARDSTEEDDDLRHEDDGQVA